MGSSDDDSATISDGSNTQTDSDDTATETDEDRPSFYHSPAFAQGERVLALHCQMWYHAKVVQIDYTRKARRYRVHYCGWSKKWDEWLGEDHLMMASDENVQKVQCLLNRKNEHGNTSKAGRASQNKHKNSTVVRGKKRKYDSSVKEENVESLEKLVDLQIPPTLKKQLIDDCEFITHLGKLVYLPRSPNVEDILKKYKQYKLRKDNLVSKSDEEIMQGLRCYFDKALPVMLLYKSERQQYYDATRNIVPPSKVYGAEHLLRLFVKLPELLAYVNIEEETLSELLQKLLDFLKFLQKNQNVFFLSTYHVPGDAETSSTK